MNWQKLLWEFRWRLWKRFGKLLLPDAEPLDMVSELRIVVQYPNKKREDLGIVSRQLITNEGKKQVLEALFGAGTYKIAFGGTSGTGDTPPSVNDTNLKNPIQTMPIDAVNYTIDTTNLRLKSEITIAYTQPASVSEFAVWSKKNDIYITTACFDRSVFPPINVDNDFYVSYYYTLEIA